MLVRQPFLAYTELFLKNSENLPKKKKNPSEYVERIKTFIQVALLLHSFATESNFSKVFIYIVNFILYTSIFNNHWKKHKYFLLVTYFNFF